MATIQWYARRLRAMGVAEICHRVEEKLRQYTERSAYQKLIAVKFDPEPTENAPSLPKPESVNEAFLDALREERDEIKAGRWHILGGHTIQVGSPPVWHRDYVNGGEHSTDARSCKLDHRRMPPKMDVRFVWETSRWLQITRLAQAAYFLQDEESGRLAQSWLSDWVKKNPVGRGWNWTSPMEPAIRLINFTYADALLRALPGDGEEFASEQNRLATEIVPGHVWWVSRYRSVGSSANNHLLGELAGLSAALARWPQCSQWCATLEEIAETVSAELKKQFHSDGGNREQGLHYHLFAFEMGWIALTFAQATGIRIDARVLELMAKAGEFFEATAVETEPWDYGDSDDAHVFPCFLSEGSALQEWRQWFAGDRSPIEHWYGAAPSAGQCKSTLGWRCFEETGVSTYRSKAWVARFDHSPLGYLSTASHGHLDALHLSLWIDGRAVLIDPGTGGYYASADLRTTLAGKESHNGPHFQEATDYPERHGPFLWSNHHTQPAVELSGESLRGSLELSASRKVTRHVEGLANDDGWKVVDGASSAFVVNWQLAPGWTVKKSKANEWIMKKADKRVTLSVEGADQVSLIEDDEPSGLGVCSPYYGKVDSSPVLSCLVSTGSKLVSTFTRVEGNH